MPDAPPVIIAGAGPCGLLAAVVLRRRGVPVVVVDRVARERLEQDVGSAFDLSDTTLAILRRLGLGGDLLDRHVNWYGGISMRTMQGAVVRELAMRDAAPGMEACSARRSDLQRHPSASSSPRSAMRTCGAARAWTGTTAATTAA